MRDRNPAHAGQAQCPMRQAQRQIQVRIGIHIGDVVHRGGDVYGDGVNIASRIEPLAGAGGICVSMDVERQIRNSLEARFEKLAPTELKNISVAMDLFRIVLPWEKKSEVKSHKSAVSDRVASPTRKFALIGGLILPLIIGLGWWWTARKPFLALRQPVINASDQSVNIPEKSIAVLPFENLSEDKANAYFADGVQDEILTDLAKVADLKVISRTSVMQYRNQTSRNLREVGQQLGVAHVLEGSVQRAGNKIRINAQLIDARNDAHLWAQTYDRDLADVFAIQSEIARTIAEQLRAKLTPDELAEIDRAPTRDVIAHDLFVRALAVIDMVNDPGAKESLLQGVGFLEEAVRRDPNFLLAYCLLCDIHLDLYWFGFDHTPARREQGNQALQKARNIQPDAGAVHLEAATYAYHGFRDYETARRELELAQRKLPNSERVYSLIAVVDRRQGRWDDAIRNFSRAVELDPRNFATTEEAGFTYNALRRYAEARELLRHAIELFPKDYEARIALARSFWFERGDPAPLRAQLNEFVKEGTEATRNAAQFFVRCALAERDRAAAAQALNYIPTEGTMDPSANFVMPRDWYVGLVARGFGDTQEAAKAFTAARAIAAKTVAEQPDYAEAWGLLGAIDAGLGRKADAIAEGKHACELLPVSKDSFVGPVYVVNLALIYTWVGEKDLALEQLEISASIPNGIFYGELKLDPTWDPLRGDPRFEKLVTSLAPKS